MRGYLIDPFERTVTEVETTGYPHFKELIDVGMICAVTIAVYQDSGGRDTIWLDDEGLYVEGQEFFKCVGYPDPLAGKGILLGTDAGGDTVGAYMEFDQFKPLISFPSVELDHMEPIPEGTTSELWGEKVPVFGSTAVFRHKSKTPSAE